MIRYKFVLMNKAPLSTDDADNLSNGLTTKYGRQGWNLVATTLIPTDTVPGLLLSLQMEVPDPPT